MCREGLSAYLLLQSTRQGKLFLWPATEACLYLRGGDGAVPRPSCAQAGEREGYITVGVGASGSQGDESQKDSCWASFQEVRPIDRCVLCR